MLSPSLEDYLEELYRFSLSQNAVRVTDISKKLNVSRPSVTNALSKLRARGFISYQRYGLINLTEKGNHLGRYLVERNALLQDFLKLICSECNPADEAEAMEHYLSKSTIDSIQCLVAFMKSNPDIYQQFMQYMKAAK